MPRPGVDIIISDEAPPGGPSLNTGTAFMVGQASRGPNDAAVEVQSMREYQTTFGPRSGGSLLFDSVSAFLSEGGATAHVSRVVGSGAVAATGEFDGVAARAASVGTWGNTLQVAAVAADPGPGIVVTVTLDGDQVDRSPTITTLDALVAWGQNRAFVRLGLGSGSELPAAGTTVTLSGGADGATQGPADVAAALARFGYERGPGQIIAPGYTTTPVHQAVAAHCDQNHRVAILDMPDSADPLAIKAAVEALYDFPGIRMCMAMGPWVVYPGPVAGSIVTLPYSGVQAGMIARVDALGSAAIPAAGAQGISTRALGLSRSFTDGQRYDLNEAGVALGKMVYGNLRTYGYRTAAGPAETNWMFFSESRVVMAIAHECAAAAENYVLMPIDGRRLLLARLQKDLIGICQRWYEADALYGETAADAYQVDVGSTVNTNATIAAGEVHAVVRLKTSRAAEWVTITIVKVPPAAALAAAA